jgi:hypothetical protein
MRLKKVGILLSTPPAHPSVNTVAGLCHEGLSEGLDLYLYFIDEGVKNLRDPRYVDLLDRGLKLFVCAYGCQQHAVPTDGIDTRVSLCGLVVLSNIVNGCDRFLAFT